ncbi:M1 family metallopeptidase [Pseudoalteromonas umbrosa]|uniref:M1 family metallopeptidase n=1 Tax=Pseudoalteromonas umbrosa TaxID=3048489 RepID=UPI0024C3C6C5|nr:M1 family metallopeptidase [Pseudoalteromonas sp. B95]MDK1287688.1 M1 family metallopeptidase [Pseudoalteromonas sp. B95]
MFKRTLLSTTIFLSLTASANMSEDYRLAKVAKPIQQHVSLDVDPAKERFSGQTTIDIQVLKDTQFIELNGLDYAIEFAKLLGDKPCDLKDTMLKTGKVKLACDTIIPKGKYTLKIAFDAPYNRQSVGLYKSIDRGVPYLFTQFQMSDARRAFPVFDEPEFKIPFQLTITAPSSQKVYANTPVIKTDSNDGKTTHYFDKTPPLSSYLVALAVGPFEHVPVEKMSVPGNIVTPHGKIGIAHSAVKETPKILNALEQYFDIPYAYKKLDQVALPEFPYGAMENAGLITYREEILLVDPITQPRNDFNTHLYVIAHELAHQWYGNLVTLKWWNDMWLNEAFATWIGGKVVTKLYPELERDLLLPQHNAMVRDAMITTKPIRKPINSSDDIMDGLGLAYSKGSAVLTMVEEWIGHEVFQQGMRNYIKKYAYKNAEAKDLWSELEAVSKKDVPGVLDSFVSQSSFPLIDFTQSGKTLTLTQTRFLPKGQQAKAQLWKVPVSIKYGDNKGNVATKRVLLTEQTQSVTLDFTPTWVYPNDNAIGYYLWSMPEAQYQAVLTQADKALNTREKLSLIETAKQLMDAGKINAYTLLASLNTFTNDAHPKVTANALEGIVSNMRTFKTDKNQSQWQSLISQKVSDAIERYGFEKQAGESDTVSELRAMVFRLAAFEVQDTNIIAEAQKQTVQFLKDPSKVDPYLAKTYLEIAAYFGDQALLNQFKSTIEQTATPSVRVKLLSALGYFNQKDLQSQVQSYLLTDKLTASDTPAVLRGLSYRPERKAKMNQWIFENFEQVAKRVPPYVVSYLPYISMPKCQEQGFKDIKSFYESKIEAFPGMGKSLPTAELRLNTCLSLQKRELASAERFLKQL